MDGGSGWVWKWPATHSIPCSCLRLLKKFIFFLAGLQAATITTFLEISTPLTVWFVMISFSIPIWLEVFTSSKNMHNFAILWDRESKYSPNWAKRCALWETLVTVTSISLIDIAAWTLTTLKAQCISASMTECWIKASTNHSSKRAEFSLLKNLSLLKLSNGSNIGFAFSSSKIYFCKFSALYAWIAYANWPQSCHDCRITSCCSRFQYRAITWSALSFRDSAAKSFVFAASSFTSVNNGVYRMLPFLRMNSIRVNAVLLTPVSPCIMHGIPHSMRSLIVKSLMVKSNVSTNSKSFRRGREPSWKSNGYPDELFSMRVFFNWTPIPYARYESNTRRSDRFISSIVGTCIPRSFSNVLRWTQSDSWSFGFEHSILQE